MKYRNPETGEMFEDIETARATYCEPIDPEDCRKCPLNSDINGTDGDMCCNEFSEANPAEAARLMGLEVKEEPIMWERFMKDYSGEVAERAEDDRAEKPARPRICRVLGGEDHPLEVGEQFTYDGETYLISKAPDGDFLLYNFRSNTAPSGDIMSRMIDHPDRIIRKPRFTQEEVADAKVLMRALGATGLKRNRYEDIYATSDTTADTLLDSEMFPSLYPGQAVKLEDILGGGS